MNNYAALIGPISLCGCLTQAGQPNVNGKVWAYLPGTTTPATIYADAMAQSAVTQPVTLDTGGRVPYAQYPAGLYTTQPIRLLIQDASGNAVSDTVLETGAGSTGMQNASWPSETTVDQGFTALGASLGGKDGNYQESPGAVGRPLQAVLQNIRVTPEDFGAKGDGTTDDTAACQKAITEIVRLKGGTVWFAASYKIYNTLNLPASASSVTLAGPGGQSVPGFPGTLTMAGAGDILDASGPVGLRVDGLTIVGSVTLTNPTSAAITRSNITGSLTGPTYGLAVTQSGSGTASGLTVRDSTIFGATNALALTGLAGATVEDSGLQSEAGGVISIAGATSAVYGSNIAFSGVTGVKWAASSTGTGFNFVNCPNLGNGGVAIAFDMTAISVDPLLFQSGNGVDSKTYSGIAGSTLQINLADGYNPVLVGLTGGGGIITVPNPAPTPATTSGRYLVLNITFINQTGGNLLWTLGAQFATFSGGSIPITTGHTYNASFRWDVASSKWREIAFADTTT